MIDSRNLPKKHSSAPIATANVVPNARRSQRRRIRLARLLAVVLLVAAPTVSSVGLVSAGSSSGQATPTAGTPGAAQPPADLHPVAYQPCDVTPRDYDALMTMIVTTYQDPTALPTLPPWQTPSVNPRSLPGGHYFLPDGPSPSPETIQNLVRLLGTFENCTTLQRAALRPDDLLVRAAFGEDGAEVIAGWWQDAHRSAVPTPDPAIRIGTTTIYQLYGFRTIDATHIGAYVELSGDIRLGFNPAAGTYQPTWDRDGYIVFTQEPDGRWLIDSFVSPLGSVLDTMFPEGGATPAA